MAYFLCRGLAAELPLSLRVRSQPPKSLLRMRGIRQDIRFLDLGPRLRQRLKKVKLSILPRNKQFLIRLRGPGVREQRLVNRKP
jgi:hypothetical protein